MSKEKRILNIGCGIKNREIKKAININLFANKYTFHNFQDDYFDEVIADYVLSKVCSKDSFISLMNQIWRILKPAGVFRLKVPNGEYPESFRDPMDCRRFVRETFDHFNVKHYRWFAFDYGFKPWCKISIREHRTNRLSIRMQPYKDNVKK